MNFKNILYIAVSMFACSMASGKDIDLQSLCATYADQPIVMRGSTTIVKTCKEIREIASQFNLQTTTFYKIRESLKKQSDLNIKHAKDDELPSFLKCKVKTLSNLPVILCTPTIFGSAATMIYIGNSAGFVEKINVTVLDAKALIKPILDEIDERQGTTALPLFYNFFLDLLVAKNNSIAPSGEIYSRTAEGISVVIMNDFPR